MFCGLPESHAHLAVPQQAKSLSWQIGQSMLPGSISRVNTSIWEIAMKKLKTPNPAWLRTCLEGVSLAPHQYQNHWQEDAVRRTEMPSSNCNGSARGLARIGYIMVNDGLDPEGKSV